MDYRGLVLFLLGGVLSAVALSLSKKRKENQKQTDDEKNRKKQNKIINTRSSYEEDYLLLQEQLARNIQFFGQEKQQLIQDAYVIIVGLGGVGSHCAVSLARSGIQKIRLIDFDRVTLSSLNRHATATRKDVGYAKVHSVKEFILSFSPSAKIETVEAILRAANASQLIQPPQDMVHKTIVVDCIDSVQPKVELIQFCQNAGISLISSGAAAAKIDPTHIRFSALSDTREDELARAVRQKLKNPSEAKTIPIIYSTERSSRGLLPLRDYQRDNPLSFQNFESFRVRILPVIAAIPAIFGNALAASILRKISEGDWFTQGPSSSSIEKLSRSNYRRSFETYKQTLASFGFDTKTISELSYSATRLLLEDVFGGRSAASGNSLALHRLQLVPWQNDSNKEEGILKLDPLNVICLSHEEAKRHLTGLLNRGEGLCSKEVDRATQTFNSKFTDTVKNSIISTVEYT